MDELRDKNGLTEQEFLQQYEPGDYVRPSMAADMVIFTVQDAQEDNYRKLPEKRLRVLLIQRGGHPYLGCWALPGGFVRPNETIGQAAQRELYEETGVSQVYLEQLYTFSDPNRDPRTWVMSCAYLALIDSAQIHLRPGDDADNAAWFDFSFQLVREEKEHLPEEILRRQVYHLQLVNGEISLSAQVQREDRIGQTVCPPVYQLLSNEGLAFDHAKILACAMERMRGKISYSAIALHLMPERFTLTQLQQVYEVILGKELLKAAFRRKIAPLVQETDYFTENAGHRPSRLYRRNWEGLL
ncbi:MAG: NUDIX hydrolase [Anaerotruncus sp.]|nr:NUDIX hydrolase [Anaerotruncus sp.]